MKTHVIIASIILALRVVSFAEPANLEVREWGTFTIISGSDGTPLRWYQAWQSIAELPSFVQSNFFAGGKARVTSPDFVRMETPVIYFYPGMPMSVRVEARFPEGRITEWFPPPAELNNGVAWEGDLIAPDNVDALREIPRIAGDAGAHYGHAREVPGAWIFHATKTLSLPGQPSTSGQAKPPVPPPWEKFIFYRGAGDALPALSVAAPDENRVRLFGRGENPAVTAFALQVTERTAKWMKLPVLPGFDFKRGGQFPQVEAAFSGEPKPLAEAGDGLAAAITESLVAAGLSADEAKAMVATWREVWFREPGTRVLALLPRTWVDSVLPLKIVPAPQKLTRVFVGRFEVFTPAREQALLALLDGTENPTPASTAQLRALALGRFAPAALQRVQALQNRRVGERFARLQQAAALQPATAAR